MRISAFLSGLSLLALTAACSEAQSESQGSQSLAGKEKGKGKNKGKDPDRRKDQDAAAQVAGLRQVGSLKGKVPESSGLCPAPQAGSFYTFGDGGNGATLYQLDGSGQLLGKLELGIDNIDWESLTRDEQGNYYIGDCGNNESSRRDLQLHRLRPDQPNQIQTIRFRYADQTEFPPKKKGRNFDCEAIVAQGGRVYLFTKDQGQERESKVYAVPTTAGDHEAKLVARLPITGQVTDAALSPNGRRLVLLGRSELFILDGNSWADILKATPRPIPLTGAGQTEGCAFKDANTLLITTEQGALYEYTLP